MYPTAKFLQRWSVEAFKRCSVSCGRHIKGPTETPPTSQEYCTEGLEGGPSISAHYAERYEPAGWPIELQSETTGCGEVKEVLCRNRHILGGHCYPRELIDSLPNIFRQKWQTILTKASLKYVNFRGYLLLILQTNRF